MCCRPATCTWCSGSPARRCGCSPALRTARATLGYAIVGGARAAFYARDVSVADALGGRAAAPGAARALFGAAGRRTGRAPHAAGRALGRRGRQVALERLHGGRPPRSAARRLRNVAGRARWRARPRPCIPPWRRPWPGWAAALPIGRAGATPAATAIGASSRCSASGRAARPSACSGCCACSACWPRGPAPTRPAAGSNSRCEAGYSDQPHFNRDFLRSPASRRRPCAGPRRASPNHVPA